MTTATAKPLKKQELSKKAAEREQRVREAKRKTTLAAVASLVLGMLSETEQNLEFTHKRDQEQVEKIKRWGYACLNAIEFYERTLDEGEKKFKETRKTINEVDRELKDFISQRGPKNLGHYAIAWLVLGYLCDESRYRYAGEDRAREWRFLSSVVNTFAERVLANAPDDRDYEKIAGEAALHVWDRVFEGRA